VILNYGRWSRRGLGSRLKATIRSTSEERSYQVQKGEGENMHVREGPPFLLTAVPRAGAFPQILHLHSIHHPVTTDTSRNGHAGPSTSSICHASGRSSSWWTLEQTASRRLNLFQYTGAGNRPIACRVPAPCQSVAFDVPALHTINPV
jgi:hypothetical protein